MADGQQVYVRKESVKALQDKLFGSAFNVVGIVTRGSTPEFIQSTLAPTGKPDWLKAWQVFNSDQWLDDIEAVRKAVGYASRYDGTVLVQEGFTVMDGKLNIITFPGSSSTVLGGINKEGTIVGSYGSPDGTSFDGLLLKDGVFSTLDYPGSTWTSLSGINDEGAIIGVYYIIPQTAFWTVNSFMWKNGVLQFFHPTAPIPLVFRPLRIKTISSSQSSFRLPTTAPTRKGS
jgi:hypothetical protein